MLTRALAARARARARRSRSTRAWCARCAPRALLPGNVELLHADALEVDLRGAARGASAPRAGRREPAVLGRRAAAARASSTCATGCAAGRDDPARGGRSGCARGPGSRGLRLARGAARAARVAAARRRPAGELLLPCAAGDLDASCACRRVEAPLAAGRAAPTSRRVVRAGFAHRRKTLANSLRERPISRQPDGRGPPGDRDRPSACAPSSSTPGVGSRSRGDC